MAEKPVFMDACTLAEAIQRLIEAIPLGPKINGTMSDDGTTEWFGFDVSPGYPLAGPHRDRRVSMIGGVLIGASEVVADD